MIPVLITGGAGYIGSHTAKHMHAKGYFPVVLDNLTTGNEWSMKYGRKYIGDIGDRNLVKEIIKKENVENIIHFAANAYVRESIKDPGKYYRNNVINSMLFLNNAIENNVRNIVFSSSCAVYGIPPGVPINENMPVAPVNPYGETKRIIENYLKWMGIRNGFNFAILRYFNVAGADPESELGEIHNPETHIIPLLINASVNKEDKVIIFGNDFNTDDGYAVRDYIHVMDLSEAHLMALKYLEKEKQNITLNLGAGRGLSVMNIIETIERITGLEVPYEIGEKIQGEPEELIADISSAKEILDWEPQMSDKETIVETTYKFIMKYNKMERR